MFKRIVVANDGSDGGFRALALACDLAKQHKARLHMISVEELPNIPASIDEVIEAKAEERPAATDDDDPTSWKAAREFIGMWKGGTPDENVGEEHDGALPDLTI